MEKMDNVENSNYSIEMLLTKLEEEKLLDAQGKQEIMASIPSLLQKNSSPWMIQALVALAAWWAAILFLIFAFGTRLIDGKDSMVIFGLLFSLAAIFLKRFLYIPAMKSSYIFVSQLALAASVAGQILLVMGFGAEVKTYTGICLFIIGLEVAMFFAYPDVIQRFASPIIVTGACLCLFSELKLLMLIHALIPALGIAAVYLWIEESWINTQKEALALKTLSYSIVVSMLGVLCLSAIQDFEFQRLFPIQYWWISSVCLSLLLLLLEHRILHSYGIQTLSSFYFFALGSTLVLAALCHNSPGIIGAILILVLGFSRGNGTLMGIALLAFGSFLFFYYYNLQSTLLQKSLILMGTGTTLLLLRAFFLYLFVKNREEQA